jgi:D-arabinose 1-dehydrogenase-like Zn-dependent alcohol dehydrogenase
VTAISSKPGKEEVVKKLGAKHFLALSDKEAMKKAEYAGLYSNHCER